MKKSPKEKVERRIFLLDSSSVVRQSLSRLISSEPGFSVCGGASDIDEAMAKLPEARADIIIVSLDALGSDEMAALNRIHWYHPSLPVVIVSLRGTVLGQRMLQAGAAGYLMKSEAARKIIPALHKVLAGGIFISGKTPKLRE